MKFRATLEPAGNATAVEVPAAVVDALGAGKRPRVVATINGHTWRSAVVPKGGRFLLGVSAANRAGSGVSEGDEVEVDVAVDAEPRVITEPPDLAAALDADPDARAAFDRLSYSHKRRHVLDIENAKTLQTRRRRIAKAISTLRGD
ncbi:MAG TPA: YdeI/OmpD-associated family protein [Actinophytocola sp.]|uniref:YdeI/OmpD-associated family protein n=1 Tax=Actinophytocola sp. TaxID=1872138 RepID=UPI002DDD02B9|nr:YdeI/OmpD-associated family protein [Actinophytocola sp.]HEV2780630.1 YdeI/OmpD-associated family protein [Actinophytocola sp.]